MSNRLVRKLVQEMKLSIGPLGKLVRFCARKKINAFTFSQAQTSLRGRPIRRIHLL